MCEVHTHFSEFDDFAGYGALSDCVDHPENHQFGGVSASFDVTVTTLDAEIEAIGCGCPKLIKMHTCGADREAMNGAVGLLSNENLEFILVSYTYTGDPKDIEGQMVLRSDMAKRGFGTYIFHQNGEMPQFVSEATVIINLFGAILFARDGALEKYFPVVMAVGDMA